MHCFVYAKLTQKKKLVTTSESRLCETHREDPGTIRGSLRPLPPRPRPPPFRGPASTALERRWVAAVNNGVEAGTKTGATTTASPGSWLNCSPHLFGRGESLGSKGSSRTPPITAAWGEGKRASRAEFQAPTTLATASFAAAAAASCTALASSSVSDVRTGPGRGSGEGSGTGSGGGSRIVRGARLIGSCDSFFGGSADAPPAELDFIILTSASS